MTGDLAEMNGRFSKIPMNSYNFCNEGAVLCGNRNKRAIYQVMLDKFGKPNANLMRSEDSTWKYLLRYEDSFITIYDHSDDWTIGFAETTEFTPDYELLSAVTNMLKTYLLKELQISSIHK